MARKNGGRQRRPHGEGGCFQLKSGYWVARLDQGWKDGKHQRKEGRFATQKLALDALKKWRKDHDDGKPIPPERQTVGPFLTDWLENTAKPTLAATSYDGYRRLVELHIIPAIGRIRLARLSPQDVAGLYAAMLKKGLAPRTVQYAHAVLHRALEQALRWNLIARNVADLVDPPRVVRKELTPLAPEQARALLEAAKADRLHALYVLALTNGLRWGELAGLKWQDVDWKGAALHVRRQVGRVGKQGWVWSEGKGGKGRTVSLPALAVEALRQHRKRQAEERLHLGSAWQDMDLVFSNEIGGVLERQNVARRSFKPLLAKAGLPDIRFHDLRHSAATLLLSLGEHPKVVQERLGHATISITMDVYSHVMPNLQRQAAERLDAFFGT